eukprot:3950948-Alexandrium_andersonii.AAC.1
MPGGETQRGSHFARGNGHHTGCRQEGKTMPHPSTPRSGRPSSTPVKANRPLPALQRPTKRTGQTCP